MLLCEVSIVNEILKSEVSEDVAIKWSDEKAKREGPSRNENGKKIKKTFRPSNYS